MFGFVVLLGYVAATFTTLSLAPEIYKTWKRKEARDLSFMWLGTLEAGQAFWFIYALFISSIPLMLAAAASTVLIAVQAALAIRYDRKTSSR